MIKDQTKESMEQELKERINKAIEVEMKNDPKEIALKQALEAETLGKKIFELANAYVSPDQFITLTPEENSYLIQEWDKEIDELFND